jgi:uncharacterized protein (UPF0332 family)
VQPGTATLLAKARRAVAAAEAGLAGGAAEIAAGRAFYAMLYAAKARLSEAGLRPRAHARVLEAYAALPVVEGAPVVWLTDALALRARGDELAWDAAEALVAQARAFVAAQDEQQQT